MLFKKIQDKGLLWFFNRLRMEIRNPTKQLSKVPIDLFLGTRKKIGKLFKKETDDEDIKKVLKICNICYLL